MTERIFFSFGSAFQILRHPGVTSASLKAVIPELAAVDPTTLSRIDIDGQLKLFFSEVFQPTILIGQYDMHMSRQEADVRAFMEDESFVLDPRLDYSLVSGLSSEVIEKLNLVRPTTIVSCYIQLNFLSLQFFLIFIYNSELPSPTSESVFIPIFRSGFWP